ncbi:MULTISPECIES: LamG domain-containing protein [Planktothricoides]|uniref:LamG domain-containing protein n=2 Tax=Planktothricoides raciborskii TaxID=132608 RepID=A0AAU8JKL4_9CYAN|nr:MULTISPECIES: LamG domain-containing protein [Planktothricoides]MBD2546919.1 LamG domain-containing protein [Planktothricoides raciborskii FACHB-1370]MBD2584574.1 LamG domain-containing protein [Planktothricoides raciborskii FACHB-1261]
MTLTGQFEVLATAETGIDFTNSQGSPVAYTFTSSGTWTSDANNPHLECTAEGIASLHPLIQDGLKQGWPDMANYTKYPKNVVYGLVAQNLTTGEVTDIGKKATIVLKPGQTLRFLMNDLFWDYGNNKGSIKVDWSGMTLVPKVMLFDGDKDYVTLPAISVNFAGGLTIEAWVWYDAFRCWSRVIDLGNGAQSDNIVLANAGTTAKLDLSVYKGSSGQDFTSPSAVLELGKWMHLAGTLDSAGNAVLYKNGLPVASGKLLVPNNINRTKNYIGKSNWTADQDFQGKMAEVRVWNRVRTQAEIQADMSKRITGKEPGLVGCWPLNEVRVEGSALKVADLTGNFTGTLTGAVLVEDSTLPVH